MKIAKDVTSPLVLSLFLLSFNFLLYLLKIKSPECQYKWIAQY